MDTKSLALTVVFASLYASLVIVLAPISYGPIQLRVADCLIPLAVIFGWPAVFGVTIGCLVGNAYFQLGVYDVALGPIANFIATSLIFIFRKRPLSACIASSVIIGVIVGSYLWIIYGFQPPDIFGLIISEWVAMVISITLSSLIALAGIGYALFRIISKSIVIET